MTALQGIGTRLRLAKLLLITDERRESNDLADFADAALSGGVDLVQLRDGKGSRRDQLASLETLRTVAHRYQGLVSVYADTELAREFETDVLHLPTGVNAGRARRFLHPFAVMGRSCGSPEQIDAALADPDVAYLTVGPVLDGFTFLGHAPGLALVRHAAERAPVGEKSSKPWFAVGGITLANLDEVIDAGARRIAVGRAITHAPDPAEAAAVFKTRLREAWDADPAMERVVFDAFKNPGPFRPSDPLPDGGPRV